MRINFNSTAMALVATIVLAIGIDEEASAETVDFTDNGTFITSSLVEGIVTVTGSDNLIVSGGGGIGVVGGIDHVLDSGETMSFNFTNSVSSVQITISLNDTNDDLTSNITFESFNSGNTSLGAVGGALAGTGTFATGGFSNVSRLDVTVNEGFIRIAAISFDVEMAQIVEIDIKPGSDPNCFNINAHGVIPVAILGSGEFDVAYIDQNSLSFGGLDVRVRGNKGPLCSLEDTNSDGINDLVCHFQDNADYWETGDDDATLTGVLLDLTEFEGTDSICVVP